MPRPVSNPPNPWETVHAEWLGQPPEARLEIFEDRLVVIPRGCAEVFVETSVSGMPSVWLVDA